MLLSLSINNQHGSLIYHKNISEKSRLTSNEEIRIASTFHGLSTIAKRLCIVSDEKHKATLDQQSGITQIEGNHFSLYCLETLTGLSIFLVTLPSAFPSGIIDNILSSVYQGYADYVQKNPFHEPDMPIRLDLFDKFIQGIIQRYTY
ncbi:Sybindin-like family [Babesia microti strain RI]|uniref:Trafficking protein particle complex subunit n=1 Tax=Babesia microti (strain RI) TaxID=1133968 RepID=A0A1R4AC50_BABMR|nr:Sybindin-like family [Babesia microti strain RI]SJK86525.1 Sybindin-like family [Babesia microti strain RI]|eukprot:XP_021338674.1 Sybindin-like family [Babesia microti strain RI]